MGVIKTPPMSQSARIVAGAVAEAATTRLLAGMPHSRPMPATGSRCHELRIVDANKCWRVIYRIDSDAVVIADVFEKKTQKTPKRVIDACKRLPLEVTTLTDNLVRGSGKRMKASKRKGLEAKGWRLTSAEEFLGLTREEAALVEMKLALADAVKAQREKSHLSQIELAARMKSIQSRVAKIEAGDPSVSLDLLVRAVLSAGATKREVASALAATAK